jgi:hypothetical protein
MPAWGACACGGSIAPEPSGARFLSPDAGGDAQSIEIAGDASTADASAPYDARLAAPDSLLQPDAPPDGGAGDADAGGQSGGDGDATPAPDACTTIHYPIVDATGTCPPIEGPGMIWVTGNPYGTTGCTNGCCVVAIPGVASCEMCVEDFTCGCLREHKALPDLSYPGPCIDGFPPVVHFD